MATVERPDGDASGSVSANTAIVGSGGSRFGQGAWRIHHARSVQAAGAGLWRRQCRLLRRRRRRGGFGGGCGWSRTGSTTGERKQLGEDAGASRGVLCSDERGGLHVIMAGAGPEQTFCRCVDDGDRYPVRDGGRKLLLPTLHR